MRWMELKIAGRYLRQLPKALLISVALVFIVAQTLVLLATSLPLDPGQRADRVVGQRQYSFTAAATGDEALKTSASVIKAAGLMSRDYSESLFGDVYLTKIALKVNFGDDQVEWAKSRSNLGYDTNGIDGFLYNADASKNKIIVTSFVGAAGSDKLKFLEVPGSYTRLVLRPGTFQAQKWRSNGILPDASVNLNFDTALSQGELTTKISALFADGSFAPSQEPYGCMAAYCLTSRDYIIAEGRGNYLKNLVTPYLVVIFLALLPILIRGGKELRLEANRFSELGTKRFRSAKRGTVRLLVWLVVILNLFSFLGLALGCAVYAIFKAQAPADFGTLLVPFDLILGGILWSLIAATAVAYFFGESRTHTFVSKSLAKNRNTSNFAFGAMALASAWLVTTKTSNSETFAWYTSPETKWEAVVVMGLLLISIYLLMQSLIRSRRSTKLFVLAVERKYPLLSLLMVSSLFSASLLSGIAVPAMALGDRVSATNEGLSFPVGYFSIPRDANYERVVRARSQNVADFEIPRQGGIIQSSIPFASGSGVFLVFSKVDAKKLWPILTQQSNLQSGELFLFETSVDKPRLQPEFVSFQLEKVKTKYLSHFLRVEDVWGASYSGVFIDQVPKQFAAIFSGTEKRVLMHADSQASSINALLLDAGLDPSKVTFWRVMGETSLKYRIALYLAFSVLIGLLLSFFVVRAVNATFKREASLIKSLGYSTKEIQKILRGMLLKNFGIAMALGMVGLAFYFLRSNDSVDAVPQEVLMGVGAFLFASFTGLIPIVFAGRIRLQVEEDVR